MTRILPKRSRRPGRHPAPRGLRHEALERRVCLAADTGTTDAVLDWAGSRVDVRRDAWIVRTTPQAADLGLDSAWSATSLGAGFFALSAPGAGVQQVLGWAARTPGVAYVEPDFVIAPRRVANDASFPQLWGLNNTGQSGGLADADIDAPEAWDVTTGSRNVVVAVIDTGIDYTHPDLAANAWRNPGEVAGDRIDNDGNGFVDDVYGWDFANNDANPMDDEGHGTHVAGTIGAVGDNGTGVVGVNWQVSIMALKFLGANGSGTTSAAVAAVNYATRMRRDFGVNVVATNNSWGGGGFSAALRDAIAAGGDAGILFVAAAGNDAANTDVAPEYPASYAGTAVMSVAATDRSNRLSSFSNFGATSVDLGAPGSSILSTVPGGGYATYSGTSMAAPHVTGVAALLLSADPAQSAAALRERLITHAVPVLGSGRSDLFGFGYLNAATSLARSRARAERTQLQLVNAATGDTVRTLAVTPGTPFSLGRVPDGRYWLLAAQDQDNDGLYGAAGRRVGAAGSGVAPREITVGNRTGATVNIHLGYNVEAEPNDSLATANRLFVNGSVAARFDAPDPNDTYVIQIPRVGTYVFETGPVMGACGFGLEVDTNLQLLTATGTVVAANDDISASAGNFCSRVAQVLQPGTYYLRVTNSAGVFRRWRYRLSARAQ